MPFPTLPGIVHRCQFPGLWASPQLSNAQFYCMIQKKMHTINVLFISQPQFCLFFFLETAVSICLVSAEVRSLRVDQCSQHLPNWMGRSLFAELWEITSPV